MRELRLTTDEDAEMSDSELDEMCEQLHYSSKGAQLLRSVTSNQRVVWTPEGGWQS